MTLPSFLIIGAAKSGTTALYEYLRQHPQVFMSPLKEPNFFSYAGQPPRFAGPRAEILRNDVVCRQDAYEALFSNAKNHIAIGEASPRYLAVPGTAQRIKDRLPRIRLIAMLRNPIERAFSSFVMYKRDGLEPAATFEEAIDDEPRRLAENWAFAIHVQKGFYASQLDEYYECFARENIRVYIYDDFVRQPSEVMKDLFGFIGVDCDFPVDMSVQHNRSGIIANPLLRFLWTDTHALRHAAPLMPKAVRRCVSRFFIDRPLTKMTLSDETRRRLREIYREEILRLQGLIGRDLSSWLR